MPEPDSRIAVSSQDDVKIIELTDRKILDEVSILHIGEQINAVIADVLAPRLVVDFANVGHLSSSALGMLITLHNRIRQRNGRLALCNIQPPIFEIFTITRLSDIFAITATRDEAIAAVG